MARLKQIKLDELNSFPNVFTGTNEEIKEKVSSCFEQDGPVTLEVGCGHGNYTLNLAKYYPEKNFIGLDVKGARVWKGAKEAIDTGSKNVAFIVSGAYMLPEICVPGSISEIWITFPEPHVQRRKESRRLTSPFYLSIYKQILKPGGKIHLKTDSSFLFDYTLNTLELNNCPVYSSNEDIYSAELSGPLVEIKTTFEERYIKQGRKIKYICFGIF